MLMPIPLPQIRIPCWALPSADLVRKRTGVIRIIHPAVIHGPEVLPIPSPGVLLEFGLQLDAGMVCRDEHSLAGGIWHGGNLPKTRVAIKRYWLLFVDTAGHMWVWLVA